MRELGLIDGMNKRRLSMLNMSTFYYEGALFLSNIEQMPLVE